MQPPPQDLPIIDLLDNINDQMEIMLKSEPTSPRMDEFSSCFLSSHTVEERAAGHDPTHDARHDGHRQKQQTAAGRSSSDDSASLEQRWLRPRNSPLKQQQQQQQDPLQQDLKYSNRTYCRFCQKTFSRAWSLQRHLADTHFYVPQSLSCDQCGRSYKSRNSLVSHKSQYHARKERKEHEAQCEVTY